jgi:hypothetical protein
VALRRRRSLSDPAARADIRTLIDVWPRMGDYWIEAFREFHDREAAAARAHASWLFLPWHRLLLIKFETVVRRLSRNDGFALPYWDIYREARLPREFWSSPFFGRGATVDVARMGSTRNTDFQDARLNLFAGQFPRDDLRSHSFHLIHGGRAGRPDGKGAIEAGIHDFLHSTVGGRGGAMNDLAQAPIDIAFWLHHCNIDRIWASWHDWSARMARNAAQARARGERIAPGPGTPPSAWLNAALRFPEIEQSGNRFRFSRQLVTYRVADLLNTLQLRRHSYEYPDPPPLEDQPLPSIAPETPKEFVAREQKSVGWSGPKDIRSGSEARVDFAVDPTIMRSFGDEIDRGKALVTLELTGHDLADCFVKVEASAEGLTGKRPVAVLTAIRHGDHSAPIAFTEDLSDALDSLASRSDNARAGRRLTLHFSIAKKWEPHKPATLTLNDATVSFEVDRFRPLPR